METKLVVLGIPWDIDTDGLRDYMSKFGELDDCIVMKERSSGRSRGFGYVTFSSAEDAKNVLNNEHHLGNRSLEIKVATPKDAMKSTSKKVTRIFVARIPLSVTEESFRSYFEEYGEITDLYMPKDPNTKGHRGIGFITFSGAGSVDNLMAETHELGNSTVVVDRATPKDDDFRPIGKMGQGSRMSQGSRMLQGSRFGQGSRMSYGNRMEQGGYGAYNAYISAATRYAAMGTPTLYDHSSTIYGRGESIRAMERKIFVGRLPQEASTDDLRQYFGRFGHISDVYVPKDPKRSGHRGFGFVTFSEDGVVERVSRRTHEICGQQVAIDSAAPLDDAGMSSGNGNFNIDNPEPYGRYGPIHPYGRMYGSLDFDDWGYGVGNARHSRSDWRYRPY